MFKWLKRLLGSDLPGDIYVHVHVDGELRLHGLPQQGSTPVPAPTESGKGSDRINKADAGDIRPELFADLGTPEVSFGRDVELPPTGRKTEDNQIS